MSYTQDTCLFEHSISINRDGRYGFWVMGVATNRSPTAIEVAAPLDQAVNNYMSAGFI